ncbi:hypothetical protein L7F22_021196 [Adiantum nelumboides]|nr:hypothetical protein [Adiantum nelumboides]
MGHLQGPIGDDSLLAIVQGERAKLPSQRSLAVLTTLPSTAGASDNPRAHAPSMEASSINVIVSMEVPTQASNIDVSATPSTSTTQHAPPPPCAVEKHVEASSRKRTRGTRPTLQEAWAPSSKTKAEIAEERFFYQCNIAFNAACTGVYKRYVHAVSAAAAAGAPITPAGTTFLRAIDVFIAGVRITGELIFRYIREAIEEVGPQNVVQVVTDNASDCKLMGEMIEGAYPHIVWTPCAAHSIDLMVEDIGDLPWVASIVENALQLINFVVRKSFALGLFTSHCKWVLKKPSKSRFGYIFIVLCRLVKCKDGLRRMIVDEKWIDWADSTSPAACTIVDNFICNNDFWRDADALQNRLEEDLLEYSGNRGNFSRLIAKDADNQALPVSWWEKFGGFNPTLQSLALRVLSQEVSSSGAERLNTPQLDKLAYVNANLRVLEKVGALEDVGAVSWLPRQLDHRVIKVDVADISSLQPHTAEDDACNFFREDMMRFSRQTRSTTRRLRGVTDATIVSSRPSRGRGRARRRRGRAAGPFIVQRLTPTPSECESEDSDASDASQT